MVAQREKTMRLIWVSQQARDVWEPEIRRMSALVSDLETRSVAAGHRRAAWHTIHRDEIPDYSARMAERGLIVSPVQYVGSFEGFIHYTPAGDSHAYCVISRDIDTATEFREAFKAGNHIMQGELLGFPECCTAFFSEQWAVGNYDPIPQMARERFHPFSSPALRYVGLRVGFHIPCSFACEKTIDIAGKRLLLATDDERKLLTALLSMPIEWNARHGVLQIRTPIFFAIGTTVPAHNDIINIPGTFVPKEGVWESSL